MGKEKGKEAAIAPPTPRWPKKLTPASFPHLQDDARALLQDMFKDKGDPLSMYDGDGPPVPGAPWTCTARLRERGGRRSGREGGRGARRGQQPRPGSSRRRPGAAAARLPPIPPAFAARRWRRHSRRRPRERGAAPAATATTTRRTARPPFPLPLSLPHRPPRPLATPPDGAAPAPPPAADDAAPTVSLALIDVDVREKEGRKERGV